MTAAGQDGELVTAAMVERAVSGMYAAARARGSSYTWYQLATAALEAVVPDIYAALAAVAPDIRAAVLRECAAELRAVLAADTDWIEMEAALRALAEKWEQG